MDRQNKNEAVLQERDESGKLIRETKQRLSKFFGPVRRRTRVRTRWQRAKLMEIWPGEDLEVIISMAYLHGIIEAGEPI